MSTDDKLVITIKPETEMVIPTDADVLEACRRHSAASAVINPLADTRQRLQAELEAKRLEYDAACDAVNTAIERRDRAGRRLLDLSSRLPTPKAALEKWRAEGGGG